jgi:hypothetical protein
LRLPQRRSPLTASTSKNRKQHALSAAKQPSSACACGDALLQAQWARGLQKNQAPPLLQGRQGRWGGFFSTGARPSAGGSGGSGASTSGGASASTSSTTTASTTAAARSPFDRWLAGLRAVPPVARVLGFAGIMPFIALAPPVSKHLFWVLPFDVIDNSAAFQVAYGASIVSFLGAVHWGYAMSSPAMASPLLARAAREAYL